MDVEDDEAIFLLDDGLRIAASRSFLSANSEVFAAMLGRSFLESQTPAIAIRDTPTSAFYAIVHFFSGCHVQTCPQLKGVFENADDLLDLVQLADQFLAFELKTFACDTLVEQRMEAGNVKQLYEASQWLQLSFVGEKMLERILKWPTMGVSVRASLLDNLLQSECALMAVNYIRVLLETCM
jgi:BTB/POZ domain